MKQILLATLASFLAALALGRLMVPLFKNLQFTQPIKDEAPQQHKKKSGTPTLGGFIFIFAALPIFLISTEDIGSETLFLLFTVLLFCSVGFVDDTRKLSRKNNDGISSMTKMLMLLAVSSFLTVFAFRYLHTGTLVFVPFRNHLLDLGALYIPFVVFFYASMTNAVNLTDGLDGLAASVTIIVVIFVATVSCYLKHSNITLFSMILAGALLGFLRYNSYPASIIMGDTGSIALGGAIASIAVLLRLEFLIVLAGGIYFIEIFSSLVQICWYKLTKKRVFKMAPIHHSFELSGVNESKIVSLFVIATAAFSIFAFLSLL